MTDRLLVFAKAPEPGRVKTRLGWPAQRAAEFQECLIQDVLDRHRAPGRRVSLWSTGDPKHEFWATVGEVKKQQAGHTLGDRLAAAFQDELVSAEMVITIGTDSPTLPPSYVHMALEKLATVDVVIGPACDGGYYLLGVRGTLPACLFPPDMPWGGPEVFSRTIDGLERAGVTYDLLPFWYDVDRPEDISRLWSHLAWLRRQNIPLPERTVRFIEGLQAGEVL